MRSHLNYEQKVEQLNDRYNEMLIITTTQSILFLLLCYGLSFYFPQHSWFWYVTACWVIIESLFTLKIKISAIKASHEET